VALAPVGQQIYSGTAYTTTRLAPVEFDPYIAAGIVGAGDDPANETDPWIVREGCAGKTEQRVFAGAAGSDNKNKHVCTPLTGRVVTVASGKV